MSKQSINNYYNKISQYKRFGGTRNENSLRRAFANLLEEYCLPRNLILVDEALLKNSSKRPDGTIKDALQLDWGFWESKDPKDNLEEEMAKKIALGYPTFNILFENSEQIILIQQGVESMRGEMSNPDFLHRILSVFVEYQRPEIQEFHAAVEKFKQDVPEIVEALRGMIEVQAKTNPDFCEQREKFWDVCRESINPEITAFDIREILIQHILTAEIFDTVFGQSHFHRENNIALELEKVIHTFFVGKVRRDTLSRIDNYYKAIKAEAARIENHHEKQKFLKVIYETFYKAYNPKGADRLGVVYTPNEIVKFMVESTDYLLEKHFGKNLADKNVQILDPATGTGTFITDIIEYIPPQYLKYKYQHEIHCNELAILPYYIANLNIEFTYQQKMGEYEPFENIVFVDTLDNLGFSFVGKQEKMFAMTTENLERIKKQNDKQISVIIGNPPYNANQMNENDNNKNREYPTIDKRIKDTYIHQSSAQKTKLYDMYARFYRWAMDRIHKNGIIAFVTNRSFIDSRTFDGFRKIVQREFDMAYIIDTQSDVRKNPKIAGTSHNVFGIQTGVAIMFLVKKESEEKGDCKIRYYSLSDEMFKRDKLDWIAQNALRTIPFETIHPDKDNNWINLSTADDWETLLPLANKETKQSKTKTVETALFKLFSLGVVTARDEWVYDFSEKNLTKKVKFLINFYNSEVKRLKGIKQEKIKDEVDYSIKWTRALKNDLSKGRKYAFSKAKIVDSLYRPFVKRKLYFAKELNEMQYQLHSIIVDGKGKSEFISFVSGSRLNFAVLAGDCLPNYAIYSLDPAQNLPLYRYDSSGNRIDNITDWGLEQFQEHYQDSSITKEAIFYYTYAVLHNPAYRKKYELNLKRDFPRLPFYKNFTKWVAWGKELMDLHIGYEAVEPYALSIQHAAEVKENPKVKLRSNKEAGEIILDENTALVGIPERAFEYKLGNRSALDWILDQYKERKPKDVKVQADFDEYKFSDYKEAVIDLLQRVTTVSLRTIELGEQMVAEEGHY
jgi:predicted helicase